MTKRLKEVAGILGAKFPIFVTKLPPQMKNVYAPAWLQGVRSVMRRNQT